MVQGPRRGPGPKSGVLAILDVKIRGFWPGTPILAPWGPGPQGAILGHIWDPLFQGVPTFDLREFGILALGGSNMVPKGSQIWSPGGQIRGPGPGAIFSMSTVVG